VILARRDEVGLPDLPETLALLGDQGRDLTLGALVPLRLIEQTHVLLVMARTPTLEEAARVLGVDVATVFASASGGRRRRGMSGRLQPNRKRELRAAGK